jgi:hypothetical protein
MAIIMHNESRTIGSSYVPPIQAPEPRHPHADYLDRFAPMQRAKVQAAMDRFMRLDGALMRRWDAMAKIAETGNVRHDTARARVYHGEQGCFYDVASLSATAVAYLMHLVATRGP